MSRALVQTAEVVLGPGSDERALGGAVTTALCGHWDHPGPCRWPHHTTTTASASSGSVRQVRVVFVAAPPDVDTVHSLIESALDGGCLLTPDGTLSRWDLVSVGPGRPSAAEAELARALARTRRGT